MIQLYNNFLKTSEAIKIEEFIRQPVWKYFHKSNDTLLDNLFWSISVEDNEFFAKTMLDRIRETTGNPNLWASRIYFAGHTACGSGNLHQDNPAEEAKTFVIYCNQTWSPELGGNISFVTEDGVQSFYPKPFSAIYFNSNILHTVQPISKDFNGMRISLVYKLHTHNEIYN